VKTRLVLVLRVFRLRGGGEAAGTSNGKHKRLLGNREWTRYVPTGTRTDDDIDKGDTKDAPLAEEDHPPSQIPGEGTPSKTAVLLLRKRTAHSTTYAKAQSGIQVDNPSSLYARGRRGCLTDLSLAPSR